MNNFLPVLCRRGSNLIDIQDVYTIELNPKHADSLVITHEGGTDYYRGTLSSFMREYGEHFLQVNIRTAVNPAYISLMDRKERLLYLTDDTNKGPFQIGRVYYGKLRDKCQEMSCLKFNKYVRLHV